MMSNKLIAELYTLQQKGAKGRTPQERFRLEQLRLKKSADDAHQKELELKARIGEDFLRFMATQGDKDLNWIKTVVNADDRWYAEMLTTKYREEAEKKVETLAETDDENQATTSSEIAAGVQQDQA